MKKWQIHQPSEEAAKQIRSSSDLSMLCAQVLAARGMHNVQEAAAFYGSRVTTLLLDMFCMFLMVTLMGWNDKVAKLIVQVLVTVANYILSKFLVFRKK